MRIPVRPALLAGALAAFAATACDVPLAPRWDADWYVPLPSQDISLGAFFGLAIAPGASAQISFPPQTLGLSESIGQILQQDLRTAAVIMTISKAVPLAADDTLYVANSAANLTNPAATRIIFPLVLSSTATSVTDTVVVGAAQLAMLSAVAAAQGQLFVQLSGRASYPGATPLTITANDKIGIKVALLVRVGVSTRKN